MLDRLLARPEAQGVRFETEGLDGGGGEQAKPLPRASVAVVPFRRRWTRMTSGSGQLVATRDPTADERPVVDEQLEIEARSQPA